MSWATEDGRHEGYAAHITLDGRTTSGGTSAAGMHMDHLSNWDRETQAWVGGEIVPWSQLLGWEARCTCGWVGPMWRRPAGADLQDACELDLGMHDGRTAEDAIGDAWRQHVTGRRGPLRPHPRVDLGTQAERIGS